MSTAGIFWSRNPCLRLVISNSAVLARSDGGRGSPQEVISDVERTDADERGWVDWDRKGRRRPGGGGGDGVRQVHRKRRRQDGGGDGGGGARSKTNDWQVGSNVWQLWSP